MKAQDAKGEALLTTVAQSIGSTLGTVTRAVRREGKKILDGTETAVRKTKRTARSKKHKAAGTARGVRRASAGVRSRKRSRTRSKARSRQT